MAQTKAGTKRVYVHSSTRKVGGKTVHVGTHYRSTPSTSTGKK